MTDETPSPDRERRRSLRRRVVTVFAVAAVGPFLLSMAALFHVARYDVRELQGAALIQDAKLLAERIEAAIGVGAAWVAGFASVPEIRAYMAGAGPYPESQVSNARRFAPGLREVRLRRPSGAELPAGGSDRNSSPSELGEVVHRANVTNLSGRSVGAIEATFGLERVRALVQWFRKGETGYAFLFSEQGQILAGPEQAALPPEAARAPSGKWFQYHAGGETYHASIAPVATHGVAADGEWHLAVVQSKSEIYAPFYAATRQVALLLVAFAAVVIALAWRLADRILRPILQLRHGAEIIANINLGHRIQVETGDELEELASEFNRMAENLGGAYEELAERVQETTRSLQEERNRLAGILRTMVEGVLVTNEEGEVILMNPRARMALGPAPSTGIGAPLGKLLPPSRLAFHMKRLRRNWDVGREAVEEVLFPLADGSLLQGLLSVVPGPGGDRAGFLLVFRDLSRKVLQEKETEESLARLPELIKGPLATVQSLTETLERHPQMPDGKKKAFLGAVREEVARLAERLAAAEDAASTRTGSRWTAVPSEPRELVEEAVSAVAGVFARIEMPDDATPPVLVEPYSWVAALACVLKWIADRSSGWVPVVASLQVEGDAVVTSFRVEGAFEGEVEEIEDLPVAPSGEVAVTLGEVVRRNRGELWTRAEGDGFEVRMALNRAAQSPQRSRQEGIADDQPEFYDFDLFLPRPAQEPGDQLGSPLGALEYVVFDTETTGLHPSRGDRVVSISAVRIRRGKVQQADTFHTLVNPGIPIPPESTTFHGIRDDDVVEAPPIAEVLRSFYEYVGKAVLVAHNAAFDKKFLDLAASEAGLPLIDNPILDTLFLSYGIHRDFEGHNLDAIGMRLGIEVEGRHTSLGDARATAEIFLRLLPLLASRDVVTLRDAKGFCDRMLLLRWQSSRF